MEIKKKNIAITIGTIILIFGIAGSSFFVGFDYGTEHPKNIIVREVQGIENGKDESVDFSLFWQAWEKIRSKHVEGEKAAAQDLVYGAIEGMIGALDDPNTVFFNPEDSEKFNEDISGNFGGIGAEIGIRDKKLIIVAPLKGTPAERAGLKTNDHIIKIDDTFSDNLDVFEAVKIIRGEPGTSVILLIKRESEEKTREVKIAREVITIPTVDFTMKNDARGNKIAHVELYNFNSNTSFVFYQKMVEALQAKADGIVLDLRGNPGGYLEVAVDIAGWFLEKGEVVVIEKFKSGEEEKFFTNGNTALKDIPVVVLMNEGSASASEILAGALRDNRGSKLVGTQSFGKGTVQQLEALKGGSSLKITIANWLTPKGTIIEKNGLAPDFMVEFGEDDIKNEKDPQLNKALEVLSNQLK
ncbi:MAG: hypothetical protein A3H06_01295 [Candidatus Colwellbacteria bacterium RIFCSPLOWO2_12_FULL_44_13]|uniref:PDZ domain-containing protein n=2 Tax=Candidatus Colwelliibacteriota TaxID=1817904 RepID=A0A1G1Z9A0_9BACT|nr:MAG: hypothetical protein A3F24_00520 [Candidatus Colwellbacteria bacterium RIFCSPHIGHO2_12_FULL_44_17]OGY61994.1 MAG: hypothetical protein A3H06_01295 [Candidatus Colwellbacteria bacterium RIFCSPLOWO2_12_FULL_44_13]